jgi:ABC-type dipeptide/oligopeptide/nickel transport system ATPase subunit
MTMLEVESVSVTFGGHRGVRAVTDVSITVDEGEIVGVVGESGSGKSTLARVVAGLVRPTSGRVLVDGTCVADVGSAGYHPADRWKVQMVFQDPYSSLDPRQRAVDAVGEALAFWRKASRADVRTRASELLAAVGIAGAAITSRPSALSGGQRQRVSLARALAPGPRLLVADEPTSSVDQSAQALLVNLLGDLNRERELSILFISHDLALVRHLCRRVFVMCMGVVVESGDTATVLGQPEHPYTRRLVEASMGGRVREASAAGAHNDRLPPAKEGATNSDLQ